MKKLHQFATAQENAQFIRDVEKIYNTNMVINSKFDEISFSHEVYGSLTKFGCPKFPAEGFYSKVVEVMNCIKHAIKSAEKSFEQQMQEYEKIRRGC